MDSAQLIISTGIAADRLLKNDDFLTLWDTITEECGRDMLATDIHEAEARHNLYLTFAGMRHYFNRLVHYRNVMEQEIARKKLEDDNPGGRDF